MGAIPGPLFIKQSEGANDIIAKGALCVRSADDILEALEIEKPKKMKVPRFNSPEEKKVYEAMSEISQPLSVDKIIEITKLQPSQIISLLNMLALQNKVKDVGGERYVWI